MTKDNPTHHKKTNYFIVSGEGTTEKVDSFVYIYKS